ncbi:MAG TPA: HEAT repeat domain-containing protein, partial [Gemmataceae bacterium]|nr:HEAT repeat domain-containing protein [Gemmataceae bacterium]
MKKTFILGGVLVMLLGCGPKQSTADWVEKLHAEDSAVRLHAAKALGEKRAEASTVVPALAEALRDQDAFVRREAANSLGRIGPDARTAVPALLAAIQDRQPK